MLFHSWCLFCQQGWVGFWRCGADGTIVLICRECSMLSLDPELVGSNRFSSGFHPDYQVPGTSTRLGDPPSRWATLEEVTAKGWRHFVQGKDGVSWRT